MGDAVRRRALALSLAVLLWSHASGAQMTFGAGASEVLDDSGNLGGGGDVRWGFRFGLPSTFVIIGGSLILEVETLAGYWRIPVRADSALAVPPDHTMELGRVAWGARAGLKFVAVEPFVFGHFGPAFGSCGGGTAWDAGLALESRAAWASFGVHFTVGGLDVASGDLEWFEVGPHVQVRWSLW